jgi:hypothetical protein
MKTARWVTCGLSASYTEYDLDDVLNQHVYLLYMLQSRREAKRSPWALRTTPQIYTQSQFADALVLFVFQVLI